MRVNSTRIHVITGARPVRYPAWILILLITLSSPSLRTYAADSGHRAQYVGGTLNSVSRSGGHLDITNDHFFTFRADKTTVQVPYERVVLLEYGQSVNRRYIMAVMISPVFLLSKKRRHYLTVGYTDELGQQQAMVLRVDKSHIRAVLVSLEVKTGRKVQFQDEEARKAGKG